MVSLLSTKYVLSIVLSKRRQFIVLVNHQDLNENKLPLSILVIRETHDQKCSNKIISTN